MVWGRVRVAPAKTQSVMVTPSVIVDWSGRVHIGAQFGRGGGKRGRPHLKKPKLLKPSYLLGSDITSL